MEEISGIATNGEDNCRDIMGNAAFGSIIFTGSGPDVNFCTRGSNESSRRAYGITRRPSTPCCIGIVRAIDELPGETRTSQDIWQMIGLA